jgi:hypothetical protein
MTHHCDRKILEFVNANYIAIWQSVLYSRWKHLRATMKKY